MAKMKMSRELALSKMRKLQDRLMGQFYGFCHIICYCNDDRTYETITFRIWFCGRTVKGVGTELVWSTSNADEFYPLWQEFEKKVLELVSLINEPNSNE